MTQEELKLAKKLLSKENLSKEALNSFDKLIESYRILTVAVDELAERFENAKDYAYQLRLVLMNIQESSCDPTGIVFEKCIICGNDSLLHKRDCPALDIERVLMLDSEL